MKIHMIGIGGAGMSPLAELLTHLGHTVTGSDRQRTQVTERLETLGIAVQYHHMPDLVKRAELAVFSSAVGAENPERIFAAGKGIPQIRRAELLGDLMRMQPTICISGTHGKTTTTTLVGAVLHEAGFDPTVLIGGMLREGKTHARIGKGNLMVAEADEFDRSFLAMYPTMAVITNIDSDHLDCYAGIREIKEAFVAFVGKVPFFGEVIACADDRGVRDILPSIHGSVVTYGLEEGADYVAENVRAEGCGSLFDVRERGKLIGSVKLPIPGPHNVRNALASIAVARLAKVEFETIRRALEVFQNVHRRFEIRGTSGGVTVVDDYAHHPREIRATIEAARQSGAIRIVAVFQPHLYSRTRDFLDDFADALSNAEIVYVCEIYKAREEPIPGVTGAAIVGKLESLGHSGAHYVADRADIVARLQDSLVPGDYCLFMGAGNIGESAGILAEVLDGKT